jgi:two-component system response regulator AtoC
MTMGALVGSCGTGTPPPYQVLVVDGDRQMQAVLKEALERQPYAVTVVGAAEEALESLQKVRFDLILIDVRLPGISGLEAAGRIHNDDRRTPIVVMTADGSRDSALHAVRRGAYDYLIKPFSVDELDIVVHRALEKKRLLAELDRLSQELAAARGDALQNLTLDERVAYLERAFVVDALARAGGVQAAAARLLGVTERSVWHLVKKHRIEVSRLKQRVG